MPRRSDALVPLLPTSTTRAILAIDGPAAATFNTVVEAQAAYKGTAGNAITLALAAGGTWVPNVGIFTITTNPTNEKAAKNLAFAGNFTRANAVGTLTLTGNATNAKASLDLDAGGLTVNLNTIIEAKVAGAPGNLTTIAAVADGTGAGTLDESAFPDIVFHFENGVTTVANFESLVTASTNLAVKTGGTGANVLAVTDDDFTATALAGGTTETVTVGAKTYNFQAVLTDVANNVFIGATASDTIDNLIAAINGAAGSGTLYAASTVASTEVFAAVGAGDTMTATARTSGAGGNSLDSLESANDAGVTSLFPGSWGAVTLENGATAETVTIGATVYTAVDFLNAAYQVFIGTTAAASVTNLVAAIVAGAGAGTAYGTGTVAHPSVTAVDGTGDSVDVTALARGTAGNAIALAETGAQTSWAGAAVFLSGGTLETVTVDTTVYTLKHSDNLTTAYDVKIGAASTNTLDNLIAAVNASGTPGTEYFAGTLIHPSVRAFAGAGDTMQVHTYPTNTTAVGTLIATTETCAACAWGAATLADGTDGTNVDFTVTGTAIAVVFSSGYTTVSDFEAALLADAETTALIAVRTAGTTPLYQLVVTDDDFTATALSGSGATSSAAPSLIAKTAYRDRPFYSDEAMALVWSEAGSGTMDVTVTLWGWEEVSARGHLIGALNAGVAIPEAAADQISYSELLVGIGAYSAFYAQIASPGGTATEVAVALKFLPPGDRA